MKNYLTYENFVKAIKGDKARAQANKRREQELTKLGWEHLVSMINKLHETKKGEC